MIQRIRHILRKLWVRVTFAAISALVITLLVVVAAVYQLTIINEHSDLDALLDREGNAVITQIFNDVSAITAETGVIDVTEIETIASRALAMHPGSSLHLSVVRIDDSVLTSARGPERLEKLRDQGQLPIATSGVVRSEDGIRSRSQEIEFSNIQVTVETLGDDEAIVSDARTIAGRVLLAAVFGGLIGTIGLALAVRQSSKSLDAVSNTVRRTRLDDLSARVPNPQGSGEVAVLARDVNEMLDEIAEARATKDELIASVSHELRTPLAAARGHTDLLKEGRAEDQMVTVQRIDRELIRMTRLVDDLLALSRASDPAWLSTSLVSVQYVLDELSGRIASFGEKNIEVHRGPDVMIEVDADRLLQALSNLVRNAVLHTPSDASVSVTARVDGTNVEFIVADTGLGMPMDVLKKFGAAFVRGSTTGTGLGIAVSRAVAIAHHGSMDVQSNNKGTTISLIIPIESISALRTSYPENP